MDVRSGPFLFPFPQGSGAPMLREIPEG